MLHYINQLIRKLIEGSTIHLPIYLLYQGRFKYLGIHLVIVTVPFDRICRPIIRGVAGEAQATPTFGG